MKSEKVYMVNVETYYAGYGMRRCLGGIFDSLEKAEKYCNDLQEKIKDMIPSLGGELECYIDEVNLNRKHSLTIIGYNDDYLRVDADFEDEEIPLGGYIE